MKTITSPTGRVHLIHIHPSVYRSVRTHTVTWCGIRATRGWTTEWATETTAEPETTVDVICGVCHRRQQEAEPLDDDVVDGSAAGDEGSAAGDEAAEGGRPPARAPAKTGPGWWTPVGLEVSPADAGSELEGAGIWSRPGPSSRPATPDWWTPPPVVLSDAVPRERDDRPG